MNDIYLQLRQRARTIVAGLPLPEFYSKFFEEITASEDLFASTPVLVRIKKKIIPMLENDFGHGVLHSVLVCRDAGAIVMIEMNNALTMKNTLSADISAYPENCADQDIKKNMILVQIAGLLHDIKRKHKNHAQRGAEFAEKFLKTGYGLSEDDIYLICNAIREHEAFKQNSVKGNGPENNYKRDDNYAANNVIFSNSCHDNAALLLSGALYDADKFRWGPDNFTHTVWDMVVFSDTPFEEFKKRYPSGMAKLAEIKDTFRTGTGRKYGPEFIELGLKTGEILAEFIKNQYT